MADFIVPAVIDALVQRLAAAPQINVQVFDGPENVWPEHADLIGVGLSPENLSDPARRGPAGPGSTSESADIICVARSWNPALPVKPRRDRVYSLLAGIVEVLAADPTLGGACSYAEVSSSIYLPMRTSKGLLVDVVFTVRART